MRTKLYKLLSRILRRPTDKEAVTDSYIRAELKSIAESLNDDRCDVCGKAVNS